MSDYDSDKIIDMDYINRDGHMKAESPVHVTESCM